MSAVEAESRERGRRRRRSASRRPEASPKLIGKDRQWSAIRRIRCSTSGKRLQPHYGGRRRSAVRAGATWMQGTINGMGERAGNAKLGEVALTLRALYGVQSNLRLDHVHATVSGPACRNCPGCELEPWKPVTGETPLPARVRRHCDAVPRSAVDRAVFVPARRDRARDRARQEEQARLDSHQRPTSSASTCRRRSAQMCSRGSRSSVHGSGLVTGDEFRELAPMAEITTR